MLRTFARSAFAITISLPLLGITATTPATVVTVMDPELFAAPSGTAHLRGLARDPSSGRIYVGDWAPLPPAGTPWFGPYVEDRAAVTHIERLQEVSAAQYLSAVDGTNDDATGAPLVTLIGSVGCSSGHHRSAPGATLDGILAFDPSTGVTSVLTTGAAQPASPLQAPVHFSDPIDITSDPSSGTLFVSEPCFNRIRKIDANGRASTLTADDTLGFNDGAAEVALLRKPEGIAYCARDRLLYVADTGNNAIRTVRPDGMVSTLAGQAKSGFIDGAQRAARFNHPTGVACDDAGNVYVADSGNNAVRVVHANGAVTTVAGNGALGSIDGPGTDARFATPGDIAYDPVGGVLYVLDWSTNSLREVMLNSPTMR